MLRRLAFNNRRRMMKKKLAAIIFTTGLFVMSAGGCTVTEWKLALGPIFSHDATFVGVNLEFENGHEFVFPLGRLF